MNTETITIAPPTEGGDAEMSLKLYEFQKQSVDFLLDKGSSLLGDD